MLLPDLRTREAKAAQRYMEHKGYGHLRPMGVIPIENDRCWYYYYDLPEGILELEVVADPDWRCTVSSFQLESAHSDLRPGLALAS